MKPLVVIPARAGSKGVPGKNAKILNGKPLIQYTIEAALELFNPANICISTDDLEVKKIAESLNISVPFIRPANLATDHATTYDVLIHAVSYYESIGYFPDTVILLQATSPFRTHQHISEALLCFDNDCDMVVSVKETKSNPYYVLRELNNEGWLVKSKEGNFLRRQDCPKVFELNGAIYIMHLSRLKLQNYSLFTKVRKYEMDEISSHDIDSVLDWEIAEVLANKL